MIKNLPKEITLNHLQKFNFGDIEASIDVLLFDTICQTSAVIEFKNNNKSIVIGEKGTGKTALFRLIKEKKIQFNQENGFKNIIIPIEENLQYKNIKNKVLKIIDTDLDEDNFKFQIVWELFLFYKILDKIEGLDTELPELLKEAITLSKNIFVKGGIEDFLITKKTFGVKLSDTLTTIVPDFYYSTEPVKIESAPQENSVERLELDIDKYKNALNDYLKKKEYNIIVLIDRLDEFVSKSAISSQLEMLDALIAVEREYSRLSNIKLKIFLRDDLFKQLTFEGIGYDKVISKKIDLKWSPEQIREFIAKRLLYNYINIFNIQNLKAHINFEELEIDTNIHSENFDNPKLFSRLYRSIIKKVYSKHYAQKYPRTTNLTDKIAKDLILTIFPKYVEFRDEEGKNIRMELFDYFSKNFNLGTGNSIPRLILIFLEKVLSTTSNYYLNNPDQLPIKQSETECFEIIKQGFFQTAYDEFKGEIYINFSKLNPEFEKNILLFREKIGNRYSFKAKDLKGFLDIKDDEELFRFCSYLIHIGLLKRTNSSTIIKDMKFELPVMFRNGIIH